MEALVSAPEKCRVCRHTMATQINADLIDGRSIRWVADKYNVPKSTVQDHKIKCMSRDFEALITAARTDAAAAGARQQNAMTKVREEQTTRILNGVAIIENIDNVMKQAEDLRAMALEGDNPNISAAIQALNTKLRAVDSYAKMAAEAREREKLREDQMKNEWGRVKKILLKVLDKWPEVKKEFMDELSRLGPSIFS